MSKYLENLKNIFCHCGCEIMRNHVCALVHSNTNTWQENREQASTFLFSLPPQCSTALSKHMLTHTHILDNSAPTFAEVFPQRRSQTQTSLPVSLSHCVTGCWVTVSVHHVRTYFSSCEGHTSLALHDSWHLPHPNSWDSSNTVWIQFSQMHWVILLLAVKLAWLGEKLEECDDCTSDHPEGRKKDSDHNQNLKFGRVTDDGFASSVIAAGTTALK